MWPAVHGSGGTKISTYFRLPSAPLPQRPQPTWRRPQYRTHSTHRNGSDNPRDDLMPENSCRDSPAGASPDLHPKSRRGSASRQMYIASDVAQPRPEALLSPPLAVRTTLFQDLPARRGTPRRTLYPGLSPAPLPCPALPCPALPSTQTSPFIRRCRAAHIEPYA